jgi:hypothetical protein
MIDLIVPASAFIGSFIGGFISYLLVERQQREDRAAFENDMMWGMEKRFNFFDAKLEKALAEIEAMRESHG